MIIKRQMYALENCCVCFEVIHKRTKEWNEYTVCVFLNVTHFLRGEKMSHISLFFLTQKGDFTGMKFHQLIELVSLTKPVESPFHSIFYIYNVIIALSSLHRFIHILQEIQLSTVHHCYSCHYNSIKQTKHHHVWK